MSVFRNIVVIGVSGVITFSNMGQGRTAPPSTQPQSTTPNNSINLDTQEVKTKSVDVRETQGVEIVTQARHQGSLLKKLKSNSVSLGTEVPSKIHSEVKFNQKLPESKTNQEKISATTGVDNIYKNTGSLLTQLKSKTNLENVSPSALQFKQKINSIFPAKEIKKFNQDSKKMAELGKSNSSLLDLLQSESEHVDVEAEVKTPIETTVKESITLLDKDTEKINPDSKRTAELDKLNSSLLDLLQSESEHVDVEAEVKTPIETTVQESVTAKSQKNQTQTKQEINPILGSSEQVMRSVTQAPRMASVNDWAEIETQASALTNPQKRANRPIRLPGISNRSIVPTIQRPPTFGDTSTQKHSAQIMTGLNQTSSINTVPNLARVENQKQSSHNTNFTVAQTANESFPPPVPNGTLQTNPPSQIEPNSNPLNFPTTPEEVQIQETIPITLEQAVDIARRNNPEVQIAQLEVERSIAAMREAQADLWPSLTFQSTLERTENASSDLQVRAQQRVADVTGSPFVNTDTQNFPTTTFNNVFQFDYDTGLGGARSARIGVAREQKRLVELDLERITEELRFNVSDDYYNLQEADGRVRIGEAAVANARKSLEDAEALERAGVGTRFDVLQSQVTLSNEQQNLTNALRDQRTAQRRLAERLSVSELINLTAADPIEPAGSWLLSLDETIVAAFKNRAELEQQLVQRDLSDEQRKLALSAVRPNMNFFATYSVLGLTTDDTNWRAARGWADGSTVGFQLLWNFFDGGGAKAAARQSIIDQEIAATRFEQLRNQVRREVEEAFFGLEASFENIATAELGVEQAKEALRLARLRFQAGVGTQLEVIQQETDLTTAENNLLTAIIDYNRALSELQRAVSNFPGGDLSDTP